ncbi:MAG: hypothetical protein JSS90_06860 [Bacteroidetes bacterium]|jgi:peptide/nickel transport system substrate-binding protein|nr:hypothetical protein [Bacteroidota bacterium]
MSNRILQILALVISLCTVACQTKQDKNYTVENLSDSLNFIHLADVDYFDNSWKTENTVIYQVLQEPDNLHPTNGKTLMRTEVMQYTQGVLVTIDYKTNNIGAGLAEKLPVYNSADSTYTFTLRKGPQWDNGDALSAEDVFFTLKVYKCVLTQNDYFKPYLENFSDFIFNPSHPLEFKIKVKQPYIQDVAIWSDIIIMQRKFHDAGNLLSTLTISDVTDKDFEKKQNPKIIQWFKDFNSGETGFNLNKLNGIGPYKVAEWEHGQYLILEKKKNHWTDQSSLSTEKSYPQKLIFKVSADPNVNLLEFKKQNFDASTTLSAKTLIALQEDSVFNRNYFSKFTGTFNYSYAAFNMKPDGVKHPALFDDVNVRKAMAMLVPYQQINDVIYKGQGKRQAGPVCSYKIDFNKNLIPSEYNFTKATELLQKAGWADSNNDGVLDKMIKNTHVDFKFNLNIYAGITDWQDLALLYASELKKAGIVMSIVPLDVPTFIEKARSHDFDMLMSVWTTGAAPEDFTQLWHSNSWSSNGDNYSGFGNAASDALIDSIKYTLDDAQRHDMDKRFQQMVADEQPYIFLFNSLRRVAVHKRFGNVNLYFEKPGLMLNSLQLRQPANKISTTP